MLIRRKRSWEVRENAVTPEGVYLNRRAFLAGGAGLAAAGAMPGAAGAFSLFGPDTVHGPPQDDPSTGLYPVARNDAYTLERAITPADLNYTFNNFYEFGSSKKIADAAQKLKIRPWTVRIDGMVENEREIAIDDLLAAMPLEERLYRHRCVEAWSMTIAWSGFPLAALVKHARPLSGAKYLRMETFLDPKMGSGPDLRLVRLSLALRGGPDAGGGHQRTGVHRHGAYGKPLPKQMGSPLRLAVPWKYGFKSIKSITRFTFTDKRPVSFWETILPREYGFWANVNPEVPHPRWSQAQERVLGTDERVPTQLFNGYGEQVAGLYPGSAGREYFM